jgi:hypothetical protein
MKNRVEYLLDASEVPYRLDRREESVQVSSAFASSSDERPGFVVSFA